MDTNKLKRFATEARTILMQGVKHRLQALGFDLKTGQPSEIPQQMEGGAVFMGDIVSTDFYNRWMSLHNNVQSRSLKEIAEEAAYTWFNRFMAIRIMAKQKFIAPVLEYESEEVRIPIIVSEARQGRIPQMKEDLRSRLMELLDDDSKTNEQFALLIVAYCHENPIINNCFGAITDYTELLLPQNILSDGGFVDMINHTEFITEEHYASAELIGWLYQFYISDRKDEAFAKKGKYNADEIAPATQIFTPNWIVKYMVENTLGRIYINNINHEIELHEKETGKHICIDLVTPQLGSLQWRMEQYKKKWKYLFMQLHENEEELNRQFIDIYGLQDELTPEVPLDEITILQQGEINVVDNGLNWNDDVLIKQLISYAIGCMMGRYSIDRKGLVLANQGDGLKEYEDLVPNSRFKVDDDGIIPLMSSDTDFADNATKRFKHWLAIAFGEDTLVENLNFIEGVLKKNLTDYFVKDFWKDHKKMYQNRPIYWLFSSKKGAFQCITYMHRMNPYTAECIRTKYLLPHIEWLLQKQNEMKANSTNLSIGERKQLDNINKQIDECREYHDRLHVIADQQIAFDLDDGVVVNYAKFGDVLQKLK